MAKIIPSIRSNTPPCPGNKSLVFLTFALRFIKEIKRSPSCVVKEINIVIINKDIISWLKINSKKKGISKKEKVNEPTEPHIVFLGLIFVNFLPLNNFPNTKPPTSEAIDTKIEYTKNIFNSGLFDII